MAVVATILNEYGSLPRWLRALEQQSRLPDAFIIVDGGSSDGTWEVLRQWQPGVPVTLDRLPGSTISEARNHAISLASTGIIAITDAGTVADANWLEWLTAALDDPEVDVAAGFFVPDTPDFWTTALAAATLPGAEEIDAKRFLPSSRSVALRSSWLDAGFLYPEWLDYCEDLVFDLRLKRAGARFAFVPDAVVHFEPRRNITSYVLQYYRYARGDGKAGLFPRRHLVRYAAYIGLSAVALRRCPREMIAATVLGALYMRRPAERLRKSKDHSQSMLVALVILAAFQRTVGDIAKMAGYPVGLVWRWRQFGSLGWRTSWMRISRRGSLWRPPPESTETQPPRVSRGGESHPGGKS